MKISILAPKTEFSTEQQKMPGGCGLVVYTKNRNEQSPGKLERLAAGSEILAVDPDNLGGFEKAQEGRLTQLIDLLG